MIKAIIDLLVSADEQLINFDWHQSSTSCSQHSGLESLEDLTVGNLSVILLERLVFFDSNQIVEQVLHMVCQVGAKVFNRLSGLDDLFDLFSLEMLSQVHVVWHNFLPHVDGAHGEAQREVNEEYRATELEQAEIIKVQVE